MCTQVETSVGETLELVQIKRLNKCFCLHVIRCFFVRLFVYCSPDVVESLNEETFEVDLMDEERYASLTVKGWGQAGVDVGRHHNRLRVVI